MSLVIDDVFTEIDNFEGKTNENAKPPCESSNIQDRESEKILYDQIQRLEKRQLRLLAD